MDLYPGHSPLNERIADWWQRGVRLAARAAVAFGLSVVTAILFGAAVTDNAFVQILLTALAAVGLWLPILFVILAVERLFERRTSRYPGSADVDRGSGGKPPEEWRRLASVARGQGQRIAVLHRSIERSRLALGKEDLDPDALDLCVLIDRRLPELIHRELDNLAPDDRGRRRQIDELVDLIEQFARHCSRKRSGDRALAGREAEILRRRFEAHLSEPWEPSR